MKKWIAFILIVSIASFIVACSSSDEDSTEHIMDDGGTAETDTSHQSDEGIGTDEAASEDAAREDYANEQEQTSSNTSKQNRKVIYTADLYIEVNDYNQSVNAIQTEVQQAGGYIVESQTYGGGKDELQEGKITARVPQEQFDAFITFIEQGNNTVIEKSVSGQDVTEAFIDLESRLKSKRVVEERLLSFMEEANKTEDLLKISDDLASVQEEIEQLTGRLNYLQDKTDLATVTIQLSENRVTIPSVNEELNTWEKTKQQFVESVNLLISFVSSLVIFLVGNLPILIILIAIGFISYRIFRKYSTGTKDEE